VHAFATPAVSPPGCFVSWQPFPTPVVDFSLVISVVQGRSVGETHQHMPESWWVSPTLQRRSFRVAAEGCVRSYMMLSFDAICRCLDRDGIQDELPEVGQDNGSIAP
jgi:hypothetical protein